MWAARCGPPSCFPKQKTPCGEFFVPKANLELLQLDADREESEDSSEDVCLIRRT